MGSGTVPTCTCTCTWTFWRTCTCTCTCFFWNSGTCTCTCTCFSWESDTCTCTCTWTWYLNWINRYKASRFNKFSPLDRQHLLWKTSDKQSSNHGRCVKRALSAKTHLFSVTGIQAGENAHHCNYKQVLEPIPVPVPVPIFLGKAVPVPVPVPELRYLYLYLYLFFWGRPYLYLYLYLPARTWPHPWLKHWI